MASVRIENHSDEVKRAFDNAFPAIFEAIGIHVEGEAKDELENSPRRVDTGNLKNSITHQVVDSEKAVYIGTDTSYALYVHEGTQRMTPNRFLTNAVNRNKDQIMEYIENGLKNG